MQLTRTPNTKLNETYREIHCTFASVKSIKQSHKCLVCACARAIGLSLSDHLTLFQTRYIMCAEQVSKSTPKRNRDNDLKTLKHGQ